MKHTMIALILALALLSLLLTACGAPAAAPQAAAEPPASVVADGLCGFTVEGETDLPGNFFLSFVYSRNLVMLDGKGNIVWSKHEAQPAEGARTGFWDFKKHVVDGTTYYSYHDQTGTYDDYGLEGYAPGERVILDADFNEVKRITFERSAVTDKGAPLDGHDFLLLDLDHYILSGYLKETVHNHPDYPGGASVVYSYLQEVRNGEVVWDWKSIDYPELYALTVTDAVPAAADFANRETDVPDYVHFNSMRIDESGDLICSFRHLSGILCLDRGTREKQIKWILSGPGDEFGLSETQKSSCQHYATLDGSWITVYDNGNRSGSSRVASYCVDPETRTLKAFRSFALGGKFSYACGAAQRLRDALYVIGWGYNVTDAECMSVVDFDSGETLLRVTLADPQNVTYRCVYYD